MPKWKETENITIDEESHLNGNEDAGHENSMLDETDFLNQETTGNKCKISLPNVNNNSTKLIRHFFIRYKIKDANTWKKKSITRTEEI